MIKDTKKLLQLSLQQLYDLMVGVRGLEPPASWSRTKRSTT